MEDAMDTNDIKCPRAGDPPLPFWPKQSRSHYTVVGSYTNNGEVFVESASGKSAQVAAERAKRHLAQSSLGTSAYDEAVEEAIAGMRVFAVFHGDHMSLYDDGLLPSQ